MDVDDYMHNPAYLSITDEVSYVYCKHLSAVCSAKTQGLLFDDYNALPLCTVLQGLSGK